jgi:hypothetical protein
MTVAEIIAFADRKFPNSVSDADCTIDLNLIHKDVYGQIMRLKNIYDLTTLYTVANQLTYNLPTDCKPENIIKIEISKDIVYDIDDNTEWQEYEHKTLNDNVDSGYIWGVVAEGVIILAVDGKAIDTDFYEIRFFYYQDPPTLSGTGQTPLLDAEYHDLLCFGLTQSLASQGQNPDTEIANYYQQKFDERFDKIKKRLKERYENAPIIAEQMESRW